MDPLSITVASTSLAALCGKCILSLTKWVGEVREIDHVIRGFCDEIRALQDGLQSLRSVTEDKASAISRMVISSGHNLLWAQINRSVSDANDVLSRLTYILEGFTTGNLRFRVQRQFKMSIQEGEISTLRQRLLLLTSTLSLPLQMMLIQIQSERAMKDDDVAARLSSKIDNIQSTVLLLRTSLDNEAGKPKVHGTNDEIYDNIKGLVETADKFTSNASISSIYSSASTVVGRRSPELSPPHNRPPNFFSREARFEKESRDVTHGIASVSLYGETLSDERQAQIINWIPPREGERNIDEGFYSMSGSTSSNRNSDMNLPKGNDLEQELHQKRIAKAMNLIESGKPNEASTFLSKAVQRMSVGISSKEKSAMCEELRLLLATSYTKQGLKLDAERVLDELLKDSSGAPTSITYSAQFTLAQLAMEDDDFDRAEQLCLEVTNGRHSLLGPSSAAYYEAVRLLVTIYKRTGEEDEAELWTSLLPISERSLYEKFIHCSKEIDALRQRGEAEQAAKIGRQFLAANYVLNLPWPLSDGKIAQNWKEIEDNIKIGGFVASGNGFATIHYLSGANPECDMEIAYLLQKGADATATWTMHSQRKQDQAGCTPLLTASLCGRQRVVSTLLSLGADIHLSDSDNRNALCYAAVGGHKELVGELISQGLDVNTRDRIGATPLFDACRGNNLDCLDLLVQRGALYNIKTDDGSSPMHFAAAGDSESCLSFLSSRGLSLCDNTSSNLAPLHVAADYGNKHAVHYLVLNGANIDAKDENGLTALLFAANRGHVNIIDFLSANGACMEAKDSDGWNVLTLAIAGGSDAVVEYLCSKVPKLCTSWIAGLTTLHYPIIVACRFGRAAALKTLIKTAPETWDINATHADFRTALQRTNLSFRTALQCAAYFGNIHCMEVLVVNGALLHHKNEADGRTAAHVAAGAGRLPELEYLLLNNAVDRSENQGTPTLADIRDDNGTTALMNAVISGRIDAVRLLIDYGANLTIRDHKFRSAFDYACSADQAEILTLLLQHRPSSFSVHKSEGHPYNRPVMMALNQGNPKCVDILVDAGAQLFEQINSGSDSMTPLTYFVIRNIPHAVIIISRYATSREEWVRSEEVYEDVVQIAAHGGSTEMVQTLLDLGFGKNGGRGIAAAVEAARTNNHADVIEVLQKHQQNNY